MNHIIILNFGSQVAHLIARRVRQLGVYAEIVPHSIKASVLAKKQPAGIILSGGPASVYGKQAPQVDKRIFSLDIPILGICYGLQLMGKQYGTVSKNALKEYGKKTLLVKKTGTLLKGLKKKEQIWMSHGDIVRKLPRQFKVLGATKTCPTAAVENAPQKMYGLQFHPEVTHTSSGMKILRNFVIGICKASRTWKVENQLQQFVQEIKETVGGKSVILGVSGGVDSTVAAALLNRAIGPRLYCVFIDHGLIRKNEEAMVKHIFKKKLKFKHFYYLDAGAYFLKKLKGVRDPEKKRKIIGHAFIRVFEKHVKKLSATHPNIVFLGQGTIYPDRIESAQPSKQAAKIKSHHNVTLPRGMKLKVIEPLKELYKDEVRVLGKKLRIPRELVDRHPFPGPGLAIRILGEVTPQRLAILREADYIFIEELKKSGYYDKTWQALAALFPIKTVGVMGDARTYEYVISLRAVTSIDAMTADWAKLPHTLLEKISSRIINEVKGVNRVVYDISQKPPATIEYE